MTSSSTATADEPLLHPLNVHPQLEQLALDAFDESLLTLALGHIKRMMVNSIPPTVTMIQFAIAVGMCSPIEAMKRAEETQRRLKNETFQVEKVAKPTPEQIVLALDLLQRLGDMYPGELLAALPPYSKEYRGHVPPHPASEYGSHARPRPLDRLDPENSIGEMEKPLRSWVWDHLMACRDIWQMANIKEEFWEIQPTSSLDRRRRKNKQIEPVAVDDQNAKPRDLSGYWNILSVIAPVWKAQHEPFRLMFGSGPAPQWPLPASTAAHPWAKQVRKLGLIHQCFGQLDIPWRKATAIAPALDTVCSGLNSWDVQQRPVAGQVMVSRRQTAVIILEELLFLAGMNVIDINVLTRSMSTLCGVRVDFVDVNGSDQPAPLGPDESKIEPSTLRLTGVKELEGAVRSSPDCMRDVLQRMLDDALNEAVKTLVPPASRPQAPGQSSWTMANLSDALLKDEYRSLPGLHDFVHKHSSGALQRKIAQLRNFGSFGAPEASNTADPPFWLMLFPVQGRISAKEANSAMTLDPTVRRTSARASAAAGKASAPEIDADEVRAKVFMTAFRAVQARATLRLYATHVMLLRRSSSPDHIRNVCGTYFVESKRLLDALSPAIADLRQAYSQEAQQAALALHEGRTFALWKNSLAAIEAAREQIDVEAQALQWVLDFA